MRWSRPGKDRIRSPGSSPASLPSSLPSLSLTHPPFSFFFCPFQRLSNGRINQIHWMPPASLNGSSGHRPPHAKKERERPNRRDKERQAFKVYPPKTGNKTESSKPCPGSGCSHHQRAARVLSSHLPTGCH